MKILNVRNLMYFVFLMAFIALAYAPFFFLENNRMYPLIAENGFYQSLTAVAFLLAAVFLILAYFIEENGNNLGKIETKRNFFVLLLALVFFFGAGEELSWGQHIMGFEPPDMIAEINQQGEFNIHNLAIFHGLNADGTPKKGIASWFTIGRLFSLFWFGYCVCIPLIAAGWSGAHKFLVQVNIPIVELWLGISFLINHVASKIVVALSDATGHYVVEVKESLFAVLFFLFGIRLYIHLKQRISR